MKYDFVRIMNYPLTAAAQQNGYQIWRDSQKEFFSYPPPAQNGHQKTYHLLPHV